MMVGIELGRDEVVGSEMIEVVRAGVDAASERNIGCGGSMGRAEGIVAMASGQAEDVQQGGSSGVGTAVTAEKKTCPNKEPINQ
jgi:hypothetical protein